MDKEKSLEVLNYAKNVWNAAHEIAKNSKIFEKSTPGKALLFVQSTTGSTIVNTASGDTWDEQLAELAGDTIQGIFLCGFSKGRGAILHISLILSGESLGSQLKKLIKYVKAETNGMYYTYEKNFSKMVGGVMVTYPYAKVAHYKNGDIVIDNATGIVLTEIKEQEYNLYMNTKKRY